MRKQLLAAMLLPVLLFAGCGEKSSGISVDLKAIGENGAAITGVQPCASLSDVRAAGIALEEEPETSYVFDEANDWQSTTYALKQTQAVELCGQAVRSTSFEFIDDKLSSMDFVLESMEACSALESKMVSLYGDPQEQSGEDNITMKSWRFEEKEYPYGAALSLRYRDGKPFGAVFKIGYVWFSDAA